MHSSTRRDPRADTNLSAPYIPRHLIYEPGVTLLLPETARRTYQQLLKVRDEGRLSGDMPCHASRERAKGEPAQVVAYEALQVPQGIDYPNEVAEVVEGDIFEV